MREIEFLKGVEVNREKRKKVRGEFISLGRSREDFFLEGKAVAEREELLQRRGFRLSEWERF